MHSYLIPISTAFLVFPIIALIITFPFILINYNKYGSISKWRTFIIYSFILYLLCSVFLVILPLPRKDAVSSLNIAKYQLKPFNFINDFLNSNFKYDSLASYVALIKKPFFYQIFYNILLVIPFGVYLRYYYKCNFFKTILFSFLLSLLFETTQLTGIFGIYSRNYRLFDVDDLLFNTLGGFIGYIICGPFLRLLPSRDEIDKNSFIMGKKVSGLRRLVSFIVDSFFSLILFGIITLIEVNIKKDIDLNLLIRNILLSFYIILVIIPILFKGKTIGKSITKLSIKDKDTKLYQIIIRSNLMFINIFIFPFLIYVLLLKNSFASIILMFIYLFIILIDIYILFSNKLFWYEKLTKTKNISTIEIIEEKSII